MKHPKVLVVGINPWIDNSGVNTLINFFEEWDPDAIAHIYTRAGLPNTHMCNRFFQISEQKVVQTLFNPNVHAGRVVSNSIQGETEISREKQLYTRKHTELLSFCRELVWLFGKWKTKELNSFLDQYEPDVLFFPIYPTVYMNRLQNYIKKYIQKPIVLYIADDNYSYRSISKTPLSYFLRYWLRLHEKKLLQAATKIMVISPKQKEEYDRLFHVDCAVLTKGIDFSNSPYQMKTVSSPIKMVYTGKLIIGRWKSLVAIAEVLEEINQFGKRIELDIYTTDDLTERQKKALNRNGCIVKGPLSLDQVQEVQKAADILVFVESLEKKYRHTARLSFSTKITDYLKNGKCIFAVGDGDIAPMDYFIRYDSAITAVSYTEIKEKLHILVENPTLIEEYGKKAYQCGKDHHSKDIMSDLLVKTVCDAHNSFIQQGG